VTEAVAEVAELTKSSSSRWSASQWYGFACVYAVASASARSADRKKEHADRAMELLRKAVKAGYNNAAHMKKDTDLDSLRDRVDFKQLIAEVEAKLPQKTGPVPETNTGALALTHLFHFGFGRSLNVAPIWTSGSLS
jgi:hypothetical protein